MTDTWREGARSGDPQDVCPGCGSTGVVFASDFKAMGKKSVRACAQCQSVFVNGKREGDLKLGGPDAAQERS